jgi:hypothetical protein
MREQMEDFEPINILALLDPTKNPSLRSDCLALERTTIPKEEIIRLFRIPAECLIQRSPKASKRLDELRGG